MRALYGEMRVRPVDPLLTEFLSVGVQFLPEDAISEMEERFQPTSLYEFRKRKITKFAWLGPMEQIQVDDPPVSRCSHWLCLTVLSAYLDCLIVFSLRVCALAFSLCFDCLVVPG